jgi:hypothetical protein
MSKTDLRRSTDGGWCSGGGSEVMVLIYNEPWKLVWGLEIWRELRLDRWGGGIERLPRYLFDFCSMLGDASCTNLISFLMRGLKILGFSLQCKSNSEFEN